MFISKTNCPNLFNSTTCCKSVCCWQGSCMVRPARPFESCDLCRMEYGCGYYNFSCDGCQLDPFCCWQISTLSCVNATLNSTCVGDGLCSTLNPTPTPIPSPTPMPSAVSPTPNIAPLIVFDSPSPVPDSPSPTPTPTFTSPSPTPNP